MIEERKKAIVIGAGIAGIATAIRLSVQGFQVTVFEKNTYPGGKLSAFSQDGYQFDAGPSLFTQPNLIEELFTLTEESIDNRFSYQQEAISCNYFYTDGTHINAYSNQEKFAEEVEAKTGEPQQHVLSFLANASKMYNHIGHFFLEHSLHKVRTYLQRTLWTAIKHAKTSYLSTTMHDFHQRYFQSPKLIQLFNRYGTYNGSNPYKAPAMLSMIPHLEHSVGTFYPKGGMISITNALYKLAADKGVVFEFNKAADRIIVSNRKVKGVVVNGKNVFSDVVVSNMDAYYTYTKLLNDATVGNKILEQERSSSAIIFYWGIAKTFDTLGLHNIFFSEKYKEEFDNLFSGQAVFDDPTVYINITSKCEPGIHAPLGKENWFVMVNAPANKLINWEEQLPLYRATIVKKLSSMLKEDIEPLIETESVLTPEQIQDKTASYLGSLYGTSSNSKMAAFLRHPNFSKKIKNLYFVGGSVHPGGGIPLCLQSAKITASLIAHDE